MLEIDLHKFIPSAEISPVGSVSRVFLSRHIKTFYDAVLWVYHLPYGRNSDRTNYMLVFEELRGTCSTKHALLAALAREYSLPIFLKMVICKIDQRVDPNIMPLLDTLGIDYLPEAHCYLSCPEGDVDITFSNQTPYPKVDILKEYIILPEDIGDRKLNLHKEFLKKWIEDSKMNAQFSLDEFWQKREEWIRSLSE